MQGQCHMACGRLWGKADLWWPVLILLPPCFSRLLCCLHSRHGSLGTPRLVRPVRGDPGPPHPTGAFLAGGHEGVWGRVSSPLRPLSPCADYVHSPVALGLAPGYGLWWSTRTMGLLLNPKGAPSALAEPRSPSLRPSVLGPGEGPVGSVSAKARRYSACPALATRTKVA